MSKLNWPKTAFVASVLCAATAIASPAQTYTTLADFYSAKGVSPNSLIKGSDGNGYGTASEGAANSFGTVFSLDAGLGQPWQQVPGLLTQIAVGSEESVWGINSSGQILCFNTGTQTFDQIPGEFAQIAVASDGAVWGIDSTQQVYRFNSQTQSWDDIPGFLKQIAVGSAGVVWGINAAQEIYRFNPGTHGWDHIPGALIQIAAGADGSVWGLNTQQQIYRFNPQTQGWDWIPGLLAQIAVGSANAVWGINAQQQIYRFNPQTQGWDWIPGALAQITVGANGEVWGINAARQIFTFNPQTQTWEHIPGVLTQLAVGVDGSVWGINASQQVYRLNVQPSRTWAWQQVPGQLAQLAVGVDGAVWGINSALQIYTFNARTQSWSQVPGLLSQIAVGFGSGVWWIDSAQQIYRFNPKTQSWDDIPGLLKQISGGLANAVWGLDAQQKIFRYNPSTQGWDWIPGALVQIAVGADGAVWGLNAQQQIYRFNPQMQGWDWIPGLLAQIAVGSANQVWGINSQQQIYRFNPQTQAWDWIPGALAQIAVAYDGTVWGINSAQQIFTFDTHTQSWDQIPGLLTQIAVGSDGVVWGINSSQQVFTAKLEVSVPSFEMPPSAPTNVRATALSASSISLTWNDNSDNEAGFAVEQSTGGGAFSQVLTAGTNQVTATVNSLAAATSYSFRIRAFNSAGYSDYSNTATAVTLSAAPELSGPQTAVTGTFTLRWTFKWPPIASTQDGYSLEESKTSASQGFAEIYSTVGQNDHRTQVEYVVTVKATGTYWYRVRANSRGSYTPFSNVIRVEETVGGNTPRKLRIINNLFDQTDSLGLDWKKLNALIRVRVGTTCTDVINGAGERLYPWETTSDPANLLVIPPVFQKDVSFLEFDVSNVKLAANGTYCIYIQTGWWDIGIGGPPYYWEKHYTSVLNCNGACCVAKWMAIPIQQPFGDPEIIRAADWLPLAGTWQGHWSCTQSSETRQPFSE